MTKKDTTETEVINYRFVVRLKTPRNYKNKDGIEKQFDTYFATDVTPIERLLNGIRLVVENRNGNRVIDLHTDEIAQIEEIVQTTEEN